MTKQTQAALRDQLDLQVLVCIRAEREIKGLKEQVSRSSLLMDLDSVPELDLQKLLDAPRFDFVHDRSSYPGKLTDCFWPRFAH